MLGIPYLSKYPDQFSNFSICPVARPLLVSQFFGSVNEVESPNAQELYLLTQLLGNLDEINSYRKVSGRRIIIYEEFFNLGFISKVV